LLPRRVGAGAPTPVPGRQASPAPARTGVSASMRGLIGLPVCSASISPSGPLTLDLPGWGIALAGVADAVSHSVAAFVTRPCHVSRAGCYGRFWWLELTADGADPRRVTVLASAVRVRAAGGGTDATWFTPSDAERGYSLA
ncbi:MAG TPA: hypothetical protein VLX59_19170, partial [Acidimicrobiales bacterium]|nr:hypothetical protein [Acidimicrobiales bacterium]